MRFIAYITYTVLKKVLTYMVLYVMIIFFIDILQEKCYLQSMMVWVLGANVFAPMQRNPY